jgi:Xaa-Pro aminopeptidase
MICGTVVAQEERMLTAESFVERREQLSKEIDSGLILLVGHDDSPMNFPDNTYPFRQDGSFLYYAGLNSPGMAALLDIEEGVWELFGHDPTVDEIVWTGPQESLFERGALVGFEDCRPFAELGDHLSSAVQTGRTVHYLPTCRAETIFKIGDLLEIPGRDVEKVASRQLVQAVIRQRSIKSDDEVEEIESALELSWEMHTLAMRLARPGMKEQEVVGAVEGLLGTKGSALAFPMIFTVRGEVLHNHHHGNAMSEGDLALFDAGAMSETCYASDITRTFPVGGPFSSRQRDVYQVVLSAQQAAIEGIAPEVRFEELHVLAAKTIAAGLKDIGLMKGNTDTAVEEGAHALFFPHGLGHMMGLDVHDMEGLGEDLVGYDDTVERSPQFGRSFLRLAKKLEPGHVVTVEPGCYFIPQLVEQWKGEGKFANYIDYDAVEDWLGFGGVRIEDDVVVTADGYRVLGTPIPRSVEEVEQLATV